MNNCFGGGGCDNIMWLLLLLCVCGGGCNDHKGCGCSNDIIPLLLILSCCGGGGCNSGCGHCGSAYNGCK